MLNQLYLLSYIIGVILAYQHESFVQPQEVIYLIALPLILSPWRHLLKLCYALVLGYLTVFMAASYHQSKQLSPKLWQVPQEIQLRVESHHRVDRHLHQYNVSSRTLNQAFRLSHYVDEKALKVGSCYQLTVKLKPKHALRNPTTINQAQNQWATREFVQGYIDSKQPITEIACEFKLISLDKLRFKLMDWGQALPISASARAIMVALVLGDKSGLTQDQWKILQKTGTAHLLAISGLHIGLVYVFALFVFSMLLRPLSLIMLRTNLLVVSSFFALMIAGGYVWISGAGVSSQRAWGMLAIMTVMLIFRHRLQALQTLLIVVVLILIVDPLAGMGLGLWLSAGAVFALIWLNANSWQVHWKLPLIMLPLTSVWMNSTLIGPLANAIAIPWVSFMIVPGSLLSAVMGALGFSSSDWVARMIAWQIDKLWIFLTWLSDFTLMLHWSLLTFTDKIIFSALIVCLLLPWRLVGMIPFIILICSLTWAKPILPEPGTLLLHVIDAGQGTALLVQVGNKNLLFDVGSPIVTEYLQYYRVNKLDRVVISHNDKDHRAGFADLLEHIPIDEINAGEQLAETSNYQACQAGQSWTWEEVDFQVISPNHGGYRGNNASCVIKISIGSQSLLLTGDIERKVESELIRETAPDLLKSTILIAPHHGSKTSSTEAFLEAVSPEVVIYPTGFLNSYHHPHPDIVERYARRGVKQYNTAQDGALRVKLSKHGIDDIQCYSKSHRKWWFTDEEATCSGYLAQVGS